VIPDLESWLELKHEGSRSLRVTFPKSPPDIEEGNARGTHARKVAERNAISRRSIRWISRSGKILSCERRRACCVTIGNESRRTAQVQRAALHSREECGRALCRLPLTRQRDPGLSLGECRPRLKSPIQLTVPPRSPPILSLSLSLSPSLFLLRFGLCSCADREAHQMRADV